MSNPRLTSRLMGSIIDLSVGVVWALAAVSKLLAPADATAWSSQFSGLVISGVTLVEACTAGLIFAGRTRIGLSVGLVLLLGFLSTLVFVPPAPGQSCGCAGSVVIADSPADIAAHIFAFSGLHVLGIVVVRVAPTRMAPRPGPNRSPKSV